MVPAVDDHVKVREARSGGNCCQEQVYHAPPSRLISVLKKRNMQRSVHVLCTDAPPDVDALQAPRDLLAHFGGRARVVRRDQVRGGIHVRSRDPVRAPGPERETRGYEPSKRERDSTGHEPLRER